MGFKVITPPVEPVTLAEARLQCRVTDTAEDSLLASYITAAREYCQHYTQRAIGSQTLEIALDGFPDGAIELPMSPATAITSIKYIDTNGVEQTLAGSAYVLDDYSHLSWVIRAYGTEWPITQGVANALKLRYQAGTATVPGPIRAAMLLMIAHLFANREPVNIGNIISELPLGVKALLNTNRIWSL